MAYLGKPPSQATRKRYYKTASGSETSISGTMTVGGTLTFTDGEFVDVSVNGVALVAGTDYNTTTANTIGGLSALTANDQVEIVVYDTFSVFGGNVNGDFNVSNGTLTAGTVDINGGAVDGTAIGAASASTGAFTTISASGNVDFNGDIDVDGTTNLDVVDIDGAVDMASTLQVDGSITSSTGATITTADNTSQLTLVSTDADATAGPRLDLKRDSGSPADSDSIGRIRFLFDNDGAEQIEGVRVDAQIGDASDGTEDVGFEIQTMVGGTLSSRMANLVSETVFNEDSKDLDFRVESNGDANLLKVDAGNDVLGIGAASPSTTFRTSIHGDGSSIVGGTEYRNSSAGGNTFTVGFVNATSTSGKLNVVGAGNLIISTNNSEAARFDSSGNFLVGKTSSGSFDQGSAELNNTGYLQLARDNGANIFIDRQGSSSPEGAMITLHKAGTEIGRIGVKSDRMFMGSSTTGLAFEGSQADSIYPISASGEGSLRDNAIDLGFASARFDDVHATNGTIQTSDENEKQNITSLTSAEITAAKAISKLFKTYKWKDKVTAKGDAARTHTGVIAQEVQAAMSAAGLDATKYAFWCSDTWTNEDGNEQTRMGVRYPELMSFVLASIEDRITALENAQ